MAVHVATHTALFDDALAQFKVQTMKKLVSGKCAFSVCMYSDSRAFAAGSFPKA